MKQVLFWALLATCVVALLPDRSPAQKAEPNNFVVTATVTDLDKIGADQYKNFFLRALEPEMTDGQAFVTVSENSDE